MNTIDSLKQALRYEVQATESSLTFQLSDAQYSAGFNILLQDSGWMIYQKFIIPQLCELLMPFVKSRDDISVLEIGPGPKSIIGYLPSDLRRLVRKYTAFEPNHLFATTLEEGLQSGTDPSLPCLRELPDIRRTPFTLQANHTGNDAKDDEKYDFILFCHSMHGMKPKDAFINRALDMLVLQPSYSLVAVFHRDASLHLDNVVCHRVTKFPSGFVRVANDDDTLDSFASFVAGFVMQDVLANQAVKVKWRAVCRDLGHKKESDPKHLFFSHPSVMVAINQKPCILEELAHVPLTDKYDTVKNWEARLHCPASIFRPTEIRQVQECVRWAQEHRVGLTVVGGGHSGHCLLPNVVSIDMRSFTRVHIVAGGGESSGPLVVAESGCKTGDIIRHTMAAGLTVPLGSRPSVGAGLWLQGGLGHLARLHGLTCDAIVGAVIVSVDSNQILCVGNVPIQHQPAGAICPENQADLLWAMKGAGTNFGIVISVTFKAFIAPSYFARSWVVPLASHVEARLKLRDLNDLIAMKLSYNCSVDAYLHWEGEQMLLGVTMLESYSSEDGFVKSISSPMSVRAFLGPERDSKSMDGVELFENEMYMSTMHGGHGGGKTLSFKRCMFLKHIGKADISSILINAIEARPTPHCYLHLLQGGGAINDIAADASAFGCRGWDFACVITAVWPRDENCTATVQSAVQWVYNVAEKLMSAGCGTYSADLGPDPRDIALASRAFGPNWRRLIHLKQKLDPLNILAYACPLPRLKLVVMVTGDSYAGKDYCANIWASEFIRCAQTAITSRVVSISDAIKKEYAATTDADLSLLLSNRLYKEQHRPALTSFYMDQLQRYPRLPDEHFLNVVNGNMDVDVLLITGMRDEAPVATFSHLVPDRRLVEVYVRARAQTLWTRRVGNYESDNITKKRPNTRPLDHCPSLIFDNDRIGPEAARSFATDSLLPFFHKDLQRLDDMVHRIPDFPLVGIEFRHVLNIPQQRGGLHLCTSLLKTHFTGDWSKVDTIACCEAGGFIYASALALQVDVPLSLMRNAGKLPPPTVSVIKRSSYISSPNNSEEKTIEMQRNVISRDARVVIIDDVLSTGATLCAMLHLLAEAGTDIENVCVIVVVELPIHRGRQHLRKQGFGKVNIQSLLVLDGA